jgi:tripartite ATP-independent transporter DctM subunit
MTIEQEMWLNKPIRILNVVGTFSRWVNIAGIAVLFLMICVNFVDVFLRYIFDRPLTGVVEITELMMVVAVFLGIAHTYNVKGHISVDLLTTRMQAKGKLVVNLMSSILGLFTFIIATWRICVYTGILWENHAVVSQAVQIAKTPFAVVVIIGCFLISLLLLRDVLQYAADGLAERLKTYQWIIAFGIPAAIAVLAYFWMLPELWSMSLPLVALIGIIVSLVLILGGIPIAFSLMMTSVIFIGHIRGIEVALQSFGLELYSSTASYTWSVLPFFILMGFICLYARFGQDLYLAAHKWLGHLRGGMAVATVGACAGFASIVGESVSATATMGAIAFPEMHKYKYNDALSTGSITGGASLGPIIPPSGAFIIFGLLTQMSIGDLFISGILPGLLIAVIFVVTIYVWCLLVPNASSKGTKSNWRERIVSLKAAGPVLLLFIVVVGGIYQGVFTPSEGGAIGAIVALLLGLIWKRFTWKTFFQTLQEGGKVVSMTFLILIGAFLFSRLVAWCNLTGWVTDLIMGSNLSPNMFMAIVLFVLLLLGCVIDLSPLLLIGVPILFPIAVSMGINPIWFAVMVVIVINMGAFTPPIGINLFVIKGMFKDLPMGVIYKGSIPFVIGSLVAVVIIFLVPDIATWLVGAFK